MTVEANTSGQDLMLFDAPNIITDVLYQLLLGAHEPDLGSALWWQIQRYKSEIPFAFIFWTPVDRLGSQVHIHGASDALCQTWILVPVNIEGASTPLPSSSGSGSLPPYDGTGTGQSSARTQHSAELARDDFGTIVTEVTTVTTSRRYRFVDA